MVIDWAMMVMMIKTSMAVMTTVTRVLEMKMPTMMTSTQAQSVKLLAETLLEQPAKQGETYMRLSEPQTWNILIMVPDAS